MVSICSPWVRASAPKDLSPRTNRSRPGFPPRQSFEETLWRFYPPPGTVPSGSKRALSDDFPALEVAAAFGALAAGIRSYQLIQASRTIPRLGAEIAAALRGGHAGRARELSQT